MEIERRLGIELTEQDWNVRPQRVIAPYVKIQLEFEVVPE